MHIVGGIPNLAEVGILAPVQTAQMSGSLSYSQAHAGGPWRKWQRISINCHTTLATVDDQCKLDDDSIKTLGHSNDTPLGTMVERFTFVYWKL